MAAVGTRSTAGEARIKPRSDAYVGLLGISLLALTLAMVFAYLNWSVISEKPKAVQMAPTGGGAGRLPAAPAGQGMPPPPGPGAVQQPNAPAPGQAPGNAPPPNTVPPQQQQQKQK